MKTVALVDSSSWSGHRPTYLKFFSKVLLELGHRVIVLSKNPSELNQWIGVNCEHFQNHFFAFEMHDPPRKKLPISALRDFIHNFDCWKNAADSIRNASLKSGYMPDLVFFTWLDTYLNAHQSPYIIDRIFPYTWSGLHFHATTLRMEEFWHSNNPYTVLRSSNCIGAGVLDEGIVEKLRKKINMKPVLAFPDFTDASLDTSFWLAQETLEQANGRRVVGLLGSLDKRKGLLDLLEVAQRLVDKDYFFVFAGKLSRSSFTAEELKQIEGFKKKKPHNCLFFFERFAEEAQFNALLNCCDVLSATYKDFVGSSNILTKASVFKKPLIVNDFYCIGERLRKYQMGIAIKNDIPQYIDALDTICNQYQTFIQKITPSFEAYSKLHSIDQLYITIQSMVNLCS